MNNNSTLLPIGTILSHDRYKIDRYVASGGFGNTYEATDLTFNERVAIKELFVRGMCERNGSDNTISTIEENAQAFTSIMGKFKKEALRLRQIHHANIVAVRDLFEENGTAYYVMDFLEGESLAARLQKQHSPFTEDEFNALFPDILSALDCVHKQGIWHLDIKPANIMLDKDNHPYLIDFGASKQVRNSEGQTMSTSSSIVLTPGFAPTEQMEQNLDKFGPWTDLYALGATIYFCLTLQVPPLPSDIAENADKALNLPDSLSAKMKSLIKWLMEPNRTKRPQSVDEITEWLNGATHNNFNDSLETVVVNNRKAIPVKKEHKINRKIYACICGIVLALIIVGGGICMFRNLSNSIEQNNKDSNDCIYVPHYYVLRQIFKVLDADGVNDVYTFDAFVQKMGDEKYRLKVYGSLKRAGAKVNNYTYFCSVIGYDTKANLVKSKMKDLYEFINFNITSNVKSVDDLSHKMQNNDFCNYIYQKLKEEDVYGIGNDVDEFKRLVYCETNSKGVDADFDKNANDIYDILSTNVAGWGNSKVYFIEYMTHVKYHNYQRTMFKELSGIKKNKYNSFQEFQAALHPGLLE